MSLSQLFGQMLGQPPAGCIEKNVLLPARERVVARLDELETQSKESLTRNSYVDKTTAQASSNTLANLHHIPIAALRLGQRHTGCMVQRTVCCKATRQVAVHVLLEDVKNSSHAVSVSMYNLMPTTTMLTEVRRLLPEGTKLAIKDPYYKLLLDGTSGIRVDNPADVVFLREAVLENKVIEQADFDLVKAQGNQAFRSVQSARRLIQSFW